MDRVPNKRDVFVFVIAMALTGCATVKDQDLHANDRSAVQTVSVGIGDFAPALKPTEGKPGQQALKEGAIGASPGLAMMAAMAPSCTNPYGAAICAAVMPIYAFFAVAGGSVGVVHGSSSGNIKVKAQQAITNAQSSKEAQDALVTSVVEYGKTVGNKSFVKVQQPTTPSSDAILEVAMLKIDSVEVQGGMFGIVATGYAINMEARARLKKVSDGTILAERTYRYLATPRTPQGWLEHDGKTLFETIDYGYRQLGEWIVDDFFLGQYVDYQPTFPAPIAPPLSKCFVCAYYPTNFSNLAVTPLDTLRPTLRWGAAVLPNNQSQSKSQLQPANVRYDLRIYTAKQIRTQHNKRLWPLLPVYSRKGLVDTSHTLESDLADCSDYLWTVRATIVDNNKVIQATAWSGNYFKFASPVVLRNVTKIFRDERFSLENGTQFNYIYPFSTPCQGKPKYNNSVEADQNAKAADIRQTPEVEAPVTSVATDTKPEPKKDVSPSELEAAPYLEGSFLSKEMDTKGLTGFVRGISVKFSLANLTDKEIKTLSGKATLLDDSGNQIGSFAIRSDKKIPSHGNIEHIQTVYPIIFSSYGKLKELAQENIKAEFTFDTIEFSDGSKFKK